MNILAELRRRFAAALVEVTGDAASAALAETVLPSQDSKFGDYQANCAMSLGKKLGKPPRAIAGALVEQLDLADMCEVPEIAGPGFINLRLRDDWLVEQLQRALVDVDRLGVEPVAMPRMFVLDYSAPNVAKPMHVGHIRSTVIGDALYRVLKFQGHRVVSDNHIGDWGTQFGMIITGWNIDGSEERFLAGSVNELTQMYRLVNMLSVYHSTKDDIEGIQSQIARVKEELAKSKSKPRPNDPVEAKAKADREKSWARQVEEREEETNQVLGFKRAVEENPHYKKLADENPNIAEQVLAETAKLHQGDAENLAHWNRFLPPCLEEIHATYRRLHVEFDVERGESKYHEELSCVVEDLKAKGLARESQGAICVFVEGFENPFIIQKKDGAFLYSTTDLATIQYRMKTWSPDAILYVVDHRQSDHFKQLFATARLWGYDGVELQHISFGTVLGDDGKPFKTRSGTNIGLMGLLDEAVERAHAIAAQSDALATDEERRTVAERIGIGAIKYADLAHNRTSDYKFSYDKMLAMTGNTAAYMQYSYARVSSIFGKGNVDPHRLRLSAPAITLDFPQERALALALLQFSEALDRVTADYRPNCLTDYLFDLASKYASFFESCPVLRADTVALRTSRLALCDLTARTLQRGLNLLGIETVERM